MNVRAYDEIDPLEAFRLSLLAFGSAWDAAKIRRVRASDRRYFSDFALYAEERGRVLAQVVPLRFSVRLSTGVEEVGGLAGVCSHPSVWGRGYARRLMDAVHDRFRELGFRISTLTTSRNIRGYGVYAKMGYVDLAPFWSGVRPVTQRLLPGGYRLRKATRADLPAMHSLYRSHTRRMLGWTERDPEQLVWALVKDPDYLSKYRIVTRDGQRLGYLRTRPGDAVTMEEVIAREGRDFRAAVVLMESRLRRGIATVNWITADADVSSFRRLGYTVDGPVPDATMALSLTNQLRTADLPRLFGGTSGRFVQYSTDDF
ncbi:MAG: GNAT family N-acetyltransferase [Methanobacteriota archaeon]|nr:MAG: GNAT family N-acetyltransferase [Euryarchaeota archaeon]